MPQGILDEANVTGPFQQRCEAVTQHVAVQTGQAGVDPDGFHPVGCGLRLSEAMKMQWRDIEGRWLRVPDGKGDKERVVPIHPRAWAALRRWQGCDT